MLPLKQILPQVSRPARYVGNEWNSVVKSWDTVSVHIALSYPDCYEIGMSNHGLAILYDALNARADVAAERVFAPCDDMEAMLRGENVPLFTLESKRPLSDFDIVGFSLGYELTFTNVLNVLDLGRIPLHSSQRSESDPLVIAGGSSALNPEPMANFFDLFVIGEGEECVHELVDLWLRWGRNRDAFVWHAAGLQGVYVPGLYRAEYDRDGTLATFVPVAPDVKSSIQRRVVTPLPSPPSKLVVPYVEVVHDYGSVEIQRGCTRGCRFCQAGMVYRPVRERPPAQVVQAVEDMTRSCGFGEISLLSLSTSDYSDIEGLLQQLWGPCCQHDLSLSLPSLRLNTMSAELLNALPHRRKSTLTFAPEAGTERLRRVINKEISDQEILDTLSVVLKQGWSKLKLYFMLGLPTETRHDIQGIVDLVERVARLEGLSRLQVSTSVLIPKPHTPCQWVAQATEEDLQPRFESLKRGLKRKRVSLSWPDVRASRLEAALSRGDRRLGSVIHRAWQCGARFDAWNECFDYGKWQQAAREMGLDLGFYANRQRSPDELLPWSHIDVGVSPAFLRREYDRIFSEQPTPDCRHRPCNRCGLQHRIASCRERAQSRADA